MKRAKAQQRDAQTDPAAFRRLCVETGNKKISMGDEDPAAFRRLCVETIDAITAEHLFLPAAFRRLCVETLRTQDIGFC